MANFTGNLKRLLKTALNSKKMVAVISLISLCGTLLAVKFIKNYSSKPVTDNEAVLLEQAMKGKKAVSMLFNMSDFPAELVYPGVKIDVVDKTNPDIESIVTGVTVVGISFLPEREQAKVFVAVNDNQSMKIMGAEGKKLGLVIVGATDNIDDDIEIEEF